MQTIALLTISNIFMRFAWYGHLKHKALRLDLAFSHFYFRYEDDFRAVIIDASTVNYHDN